MKKVLLLGDSIRENYQCTVQELLKEIAEVYYTNDNGRFSSFMLRFLHEWFNAISRHGEFEFDIIHFNCGLWDVLRLSNEERNFIDKDQYAQNLKRIVDRIRWFYPNAQIIFGLTTKIIEPGFEPGTETGCRLNSDIEEYNKIASDLMSNLGVAINDLWEVSVGVPAEARSDMVHFDTDLGKQILGNKVAMEIRKWL